MLTYEERMIAPHKEVRNNGTDLVDNVEIYGLVITSDAVLTSIFIDGKNVTVERGYAGLTLTAGASDDIFTAMGSHITSYELASGGVKELHDQPN